MKLDYIVNGLNYIDYIVKQLIEANHESYYIKFMCFLNSEVLTLDDSVLT